MHELLAALHDVWAWWLQNWIWVIAAGNALFLIYGYFEGPGWLPHSTCPYCCWCSGQEPLGDRIEGRLRARLVGGDAR